MATDIQQHPPHHCLICAAQTHFFFTKTYPAYAGSPFPETMQTEYWKCERCGFVISKAQQAMSAAEWSSLNSNWHHYFESNPTATGANNQPPYADQALALQMLGKNGIVDLTDTLDYAAGYGTLARFLRKYLSLNINIFDRYVRNDASGLKYIAEDTLKKYQLVINSAMFEHVTTRSALDEINALVADDGVLMLHTLICERIPQDPDWFYLSPRVHTAFHTNQSMERLMQQWNYAASVYSPQAKSWFLFKKDYPQLADLPTKVEQLNREIQATYFHYKPGFVDYWKGF